MQISKIRQTKDGSCLMSDKWTRQQSKDICKTVRQNLDSFLYEEKKALFYPNQILPGSFFIKK